MAHYTIHSGCVRRRDCREFGRLVGICSLAMAAAGATLRAEPAGNEPFEVHPDQVYLERESGPLKADVFVPVGEGPFPTMLVVHGGAWARGTKEQLGGAARGLAAAGYTAAAISYRLAPQHQFPAQVHDCRAAVRWLREQSDQYKVDPNRIGGYGYSAGGHLVAMLGTLSDDQLREPGLAADAPSARLQVVAAGGAPCDFEMLEGDSQRLAYWLGGTPAEKPGAYHNATPGNFATADDPPMFFFHGTRDHLVSLGSPQRMVGRLQAINVAAEFYEVTDAGHLSAAINRQALRRALAFVDRHLKTAEPPAADRENTDGQ